MTRTYLSGLEATKAVASLSLLRTLRGKAIWFVFALGLFPTLIAVLWRANGINPGEAWDRALVTFTLVQAIVTPILVASSLSDEIDDRTAAYLWSRALPRWSLLAGKVLGLAPLVGAALALGLLATWLVLGGPAAIAVVGLVRAIGAFLAGAVAASAVSSLIATLAPRFATPIAVGWLLLVDTLFAGLDLGVRAVAVAFGTRELARGSTSLLGPISLVVLTLVAMTIAIRRVKRIE